MTQDWLTDDIDTDKPNSGRMFDYYLGGSHNLPIDRQYADQILQTNPDALSIARANRAFLQRSTRYLVNQGIDQFLDIGSGIPTLGNVHETAHAINPNVKVVYVDLDPITVRHAEQILQGTANVTVLQGDVTQPPSILEHSQVQQALDFNRPLAITIFLLMHFITDDSVAYPVVEAYKRALPVGGYLVLGNTTYEGVSDDLRESSTQIYARGNNQTKPRSRAEIARFFDGLTIIEPGVVYPPQWHPENPDEIFADEPTRAWTLVGMGQKR